MGGIDILSGNDILSAAAKLLQEGINAQREEDGKTPLILAIESGNRKAVQLLLRSGADADLGDRSGTPPITHATLHERHLIMQDLARAGADLNKKNRLGVSALATAAMHSLNDEIDVLLDLGADIEDRDDMGCTPIFYSGYHSGSIMAMFNLLEHGANFEAENNQGVSAHFILSKRFNDGATFDPDYNPLAKQREIARQMQEHLTKSLDPV